MSSFACMFVLLCGNHVVCKTEKYFLGLRRLHYPSYARLGWTVLYVWMSAVWVSTVSLRV